MDVLARLSSEHDTLLPLMADIQSAAESGDNTTLVEKLKAGRAELTSELDAHIALEEDTLFVSIEEVAGEEFVALFRAEHAEIRGLRDKVLTGADAGDVSVDLCLRLCDLILAHMQREDAMLFPSARTMLEEDSLVMYS